MQLPARWFILVAALVVAVLALAANAVAFRLESPAASLSATTGAPLAAPPPPTELSGEHTRSFDVMTRVAANGDVRVQETIVQDFGVVPRHGIERIIPLRDGRGVHDMDDLVVSTSVGTPGDVSISPSSDTVKIRIGDPDTTITGPHTYRLAYDLGGMIDRNGNGQARLAIDAISAWQQTIDTLRYTVIAPGPPTTFRCEQGRLESETPCASKRRTANGATFTGSDIPFEYTFTVRLTWPDTVVAVNKTESSLGTADVGYALLAGAAIAFVGWRYRRRWRHLFAAAQTQLWATFGPDVAGAQTVAYDLTGEPAIEFVPPMGLRPGEAGTLVEVGSTKLLTATVVDLAARGAMKITEIEGSWKLERQNRDVALTDDEQVVMDGLFGSSDTTRLDDRGTELGALAGELAEHLTDDLETRGLAVQGTHAGGLSASTKQLWLLILGIVAVAVGAVIHVIVVTDATGGRDAALAIEAAVVVLIILGVGALKIRRAAHGLTPLGLAALWRVRGFRRFFTQSEAMHARAAADQGLLRQYMGYAIAFGYVTQWIAAFDAPDTSDWFESTSPMDRAFIGFTAASMWSPPPSTSSSGFGGGGGGGGGGSGGGGGGSW